jgi:hypothetical protein
MEVNETQEEVIKNLNSWLTDYEGEYFDEVATEGKSQKIAYLKGIIQSIETCVDSIYKGGIENGLDAISRIYFSNAKKNYNDNKTQGDLDGYYDSNFYNSAGIVWGFREVIEHLSGFPEDFQHAHTAESFDVEFEDWGNQEMKTHGKYVSFKDWLDEEGENHGDMTLMDWAKHEDESHDERYDVESFEANATSCFKCGKSGYDDEMSNVEGGYLCARCANPHIDFSKIYQSELGITNSGSSLVKNMVAISGLAFAIYAMKSWKS